MVEINHDIILEVTHEVAKILREERRALRNPRRVPEIVLDVLSKYKLDTSADTVPMICSHLSRRRSAASRKKKVSTRRREQNMIRIIVSAEMLEDAQDAENNNRLLLGDDY